MKMTAGEISRDARKPGRSKTSAQRLPCGRAPAVTASIGEDFIDSTVRLRPQSRRVWPPVAEIALESLTKVYSDGTRAVSDLDLQIGDGELVVFVGPSGCGKTSALRMIAGLEEISGGVVRVGG